MPVDDLEVKLELDSPTEPVTLAPFAVEEPHPQYGLYKRRWAGLFALFFLNVGSASAWSFFGAITIPTAERFGFSTNQVNWLGNTVSICFIPVSIVTPMLVGKFGVRGTSLGAAVFVLVSGWLRYAGTSDSLSPAGRYALMLIAQIVVGVPQSIFQVIGPAFSELWFDLKFRTTATMIIAVSNPLGVAVGQLISPIPSDPKNAVLILAVMSSVIAPLSLLIGAAPPLPPTHAASKKSPGLLSLLRALVGRHQEAELAIEPRERIDFALVTFVFSVAVQCTSTFSVLSGEILEPYGYSPDQAGFIGAALLLSGILAAALAAPLLDRVITHHMNIVLRVMVPVLAAGWIGFIFAVRKDGIGGLFADAVVIGVASLILLPVGLELGVELTRHADASSAILWCCANATNVIFIPIFQALRAGDNADPPRNHKHGLILNGALMGLCGLLAFGIRGQQRRRELDLQKSQRGL